MKRVKRMSDFISGFFSWGKPKEEPIEPREEVVEPKEEVKEYIFNKTVKTQEGDNARKAILEYKEGEEDDE